MTPILYLIIGTTITTQPMSTMDGCIAALRGLDAAAAYRSYCIDPRSGETVTGRHRLKTKPAEPPAAKPAATPASLPEWDV
jgi:hypothetical protein